MPEWRRRPARASGVPRKLNSLGNGVPRVETALSRFPKAMSALRSHWPALSQGQRAPFEAMACPGTSPRLMSPTEASRSGRTITRTGVATAPSEARARTVTGPGLATTRPSSRNRPSSSEVVSPAARQCAPRERVSSTSEADGGACEPVRTIRPPGATARPAAVASNVAPAPAPPEGVSDETRNATTPIAEASASSAETRSRADAGGAFGSVRRRTRISPGLGWGSLSGALGRGSLLGGLAWGSLSGAPRAPPRPAAVWGPMPDRSLVS
jgi:hypothetical protein